MPRDFRSQRVDAVILRHNDWGEADRLLVLFTSEMGKVRAVAKGVRKMRSRKAGHLEPFSRTTLLLARGRDLWIVTQAEMQEAFQPIRESLIRTAYASYIIELLDRFSYEDGKNASVFRLLIDTLRRIEQEEDAFLAVRYFEIRFLDLLGFRPNLFECVECGKKIEPRDQFFSALQGGARCPACGFAAGSRPVSVKALRYMRHLQRSSYRDALRLNPPAHIREEMESLFHFYLTYLLEREINSAAFIKEVRGSFDP
jgi:DNA repair protein RecO (recombination protein O)